MRKSKLSSEEVHAAEVAAAEKKDIRKTGFNMMHERDASYKEMSNGVVMLWNVPEERRLNQQVYESVPEDGFALVVDGKKIIFNTDEFRQSLRWA